MHFLKKYSILIIRIKEIGNLKTSRAYDLPLRIFHWLFALLFLTSFSIAKLIDDESIVFVYHMLSGIMMVFIIIMRGRWGDIWP